MKTFLLVASLLGLATLAHAKEVTPCSNVVYSTSAQTSVQTKTAALTINAMILVGQNDFAKAKKILDEFVQKTLAGMDAKMSGLSIEQQPGAMIRVQANISARVPLDKIEAVKKEIGQQNREGVSFEIVRFDFSASEDEVRKAQKEVRQKIYLAALEEQRTLEGMFHMPYRVVQIEFLDEPRVPILPREKASMALMASSGDAALIESAPISQEVRTSARVMLRSCE